MKVIFKEYLLDILMEPHIHLSEYFKTQDPSSSITDVLQHLYKKYNIRSKQCGELYILYNEYSYDRKKSKIESECRSIVINEKLSILCYSCESPLYNIDAINHMWKNPDVPKNITLCYEGSLISLFNYDNEWFVSSRKYVYNKDSEETGHYKMFMDVLRNDGHVDLNSFTKDLDNTNSYHFVLIHHLNKNIVNYETYFGKNYMKLCFIFARDNITHIEINSSDIMTTSGINFKSDNIFIPKKLEEDIVEKTTTEHEIYELPLYEGIVISMQGITLKIQNPSYQFHRVIGSEKNIYRGLLSLYLKNTLTKSLELSDNLSQFKIINNPLNTKETFDITGILFGVLKVVTSELYHLFNILYDNQGNNVLHNNTKSLYTKLPEEYKAYLFYIRGIFYGNLKTNQLHLSTDSVTLDNLSEKNIYNLIKKKDVRTLVNFIRARKLMLNWIRSENSDETTLFNTSLFKCNKIYYKLTSIYTNKLFPEIMPSDLPTIYTPLKEVIVI